MAARDIKVRELAKELGVSSRQIIDRSRAEGLCIQNSITRLPPDKARLIRSWFSDQAQPDKSGGSATAGDT